MHLHVLAPCAFFFKEASCILVVVMIKIGVSRERISCIKSVIIFSNPAIFNRTLAFYAF